MNNGANEQGRQPLKTLGKPEKVFKPVSAKEQVIYIKDRVAKIKEEEQENNVTVEKYLSLADLYFLDGYITSTTEERTEFEECCRFIGSQLTKMQYEKDYFLRLVKADISGLNVTERFDKTLLMYVMNPTNNIIKKNLKRCIKELMISNPKVYLYKNLYKDFELITEVTEHMLVDDLIEIDITYLMQIFDNLPS